MTNLGPQAKIHRDLQQADNSHNDPHRANLIIIAFLTGIIGTHEQPRQMRFNERTKSTIFPLPLHPPHLHSLQDPTCLVGQ